MKLLVEFAADYRKDENAGKAKYTGKVIEITGSINAFGRMESGDPYLVIHSEKLPFLCFMKSKNPWNILVPGHSVKLRGVLSQKRRIMGLANCHIIESTGEPAPKLTANQLAKEYDANPMATQKKYKAKSNIILQGVIAQKVVNSERGLVVIYFKHSGKCKVFCEFPLSTSAINNYKDLAVGKKIQIFGRYNTRLANKNSFGLDNCVLFLE